MKVFIKRFNNNYHSPKLVVEQVCVENGFAGSSTLDDMYETDGEWK
ncbi:MAG: hypothetical protein IKL20_06955 [Alistipes sp.]|nr:hypothetical protein [Alistipes sp.]